jgi:hypothetical protein
VLLTLGGALALAAPIAWLVGVYLASFGVPVAVRILIGLLMVPALFALILVATSIVWGLRERQRSRASIRAIGTDGRSLGTEERDALDRMEDVERSPLLGVIGIGRTVEADGISVEFLAVELRELGGSITLRASGPLIEKSSQTALPPWPSLTVSDERGTRYIIIPRGGGGGGGSIHYDLRFMPAPPPAAECLTFGINDFASGWPLGPAASMASHPDAARWNVSVELQPLR